MIKNAYSIFDSVAGQFADPFFAVNEGIARRIVSNSLEGEGFNSFRSNCSDFTLFCVGSFSSDSGTFDKFDTPIFVVRLSDLLKEGDSNV